MLYNDEHPDGRSDSSHGHTKGLQMFNERGGFWMIHSVPRFPSPESPYAYPKSGSINGQSFICVSFRTEMLDALGMQLLYNQPSIYASQWPTSFASRFPTMSLAIAGRPLPKEIKVFFSVQNLTSAAGRPMTSFAKHKKWGKDLYSELLAPAIQDPIYVQTWLNGISEDLPSSCDQPFQVINVRSVHPNGVAFSNGKDHAKWAAGDKATVLCIGDINRQTSQLKRGGGALCLTDINAWQLFREAVGRVEECPV